MNADKLVNSLRGIGINFYTGVPDSLLKDFCQTVTNIVRKECHVIAPNEGTAIALAIGRHLASGDVPLVYMQNSGLGNAFNPLASLAHPDIYQIPILLMIGWRGEPGTSDEPQHMVQGGITKESLELLRIPYLVIREDTDLLEIENFVGQIQSGRAGPHALLVSTGTFEKGSTAPRLDLRQTFSRLDATNCIINHLKDNAIVVATTGKLARELNEIREASGRGGTDFLVVGGMGHASGIALGISLAKPGRSVVCLDGDGAAQMHLGVFALVGETGPKNLIHIIFNNGTHESVGGQPVASPSLDYRKLAKVCGYRYSVKVTNAEELRRELDAIDLIDGPSLIEVSINSLSRNDLSRPKRSPLENKIKFQDHIQTGQ